MQQWEWPDASSRSVFVWSAQQMCRPGSVVTSAFVAGRQIAVHAGPAAACRTYRNRKKGAGRSFSDQPAPVAFFFQVSFPKSLRRRQLRLRFPVIGSSARPLSSGKSAYLRKISIPETRSGILIPESCGCSAPCGGNPDCPSSSCGGTPAAAPVFRQGSARRTPADDSRGRYAPP